jgi:hypothetical protein
MFQDTVIYFDNYIFLVIFNFFHNRSIFIKKAKSIYGAYKNGLGLFSLPRSMSLSFSRFNASLSDFSYLAFNIVL